MKKPCPVCEGSGQISYFGGESRFVITWEDCPDCLGSGLELTDEEEVKDDEKKNKTNTKRCDEHGL